MSTDPLDPVRQAREALDRADYARDQAIDALADACRTARRQGVRPKLIIEAADMKPSTFYALIGPAEVEP
jgi:hypothetical protein